MDRYCSLLLLAGLFPLYRAWKASAGTTLRPALMWACLAWGSVSLAWAFDASSATRFLTLCLAACPGIAVLGARRPGVAAWNLVVVGLLAALSRPWLEGLGQLRLDTPHLLFLTLALAVGGANYLPTRRGIAALVFLVWGAGEVGQMGGIIPLPQGLLPLFLGAVPWLAQIRPRGEDLVGKWRTFRDAYGFLWAQRMREQFDRVTANAGLPLEMGWTGPRWKVDPTASQIEHAGELLDATLRRFESERPAKPGRAV